MTWKDFKKKNISLNYTVMLLPHSQKKPIHFKTPVWTFGLFFLFILLLTGTSLFFAGSRLQLKRVQEEKAQLEQEWELLAAQKKQAEEENETLRLARELQEQEISQLEQRTRDTLKELEELVEREAQIREELGLQQMLADDGSEDDGSEAGGSEGDGTEEAGEDGGQTGDGTGVGQTERVGTRLAADADADRDLAAAGGIGAGAELFLAAAGGTMQVASVGLPIELAENAADFRSIQSELSYLQDSLAEKTGQYEGYQNIITEQKEAEAAQVAQKEALRRDIVGNALQYVGKRYVYGGNDPNTGVDCSGFTRYIMGNTAGVYLNRTAASQSTQGQAVSAGEAKPGDLVFYSNGGGVNHVAIYIGDGQVVHASNERTGIITSDMYYRTPVRIMNVLGD